jgi:hypothetical protein
VQRAGLFLVAVTFAFVSLILVGQALDATVLRLPGLVYLLAACDPPAILGAWLAALGSARAGSAQVARGALAVAALSLTLVGAVVVGDVVLGRIAPGSALAATLGSKPAWLAADAGTVLALGTLALGSARICRALGEPLSTALLGVVGLTLATRALAGVWGQFAPVPWPFRVAEAALFASVALACRAASSCLGRPSVRP